MVVVGKCKWLHYSFYSFIKHNVSDVASSCLHDVLLVLCGLADHLSIAGLNGLDENGFLGVSL